jgi:hypothetical protein
VEQHGAAEGVHRGNAVGGSGDVPTAKAEEERVQTHSHRTPTASIGACRQRHVVETPGGQQAIVRWYGCRRGANLRREDTARSEARSRRESRPGHANAVNPMTGTGVQQTRSPSPEQAVEAVRNRKDGTRSALGRVSPKGARERLREWTAAEMSVEG